jgi:NAD(P)-dependent dehydrogenase (short-subunit alcohol dehydrogenase family)
MTAWLRGKTAVVTGASRGIGRATGEALARAGADVVLAARSGEVLDEIASSLSSEGFSARAFPCDVSSESEVKMLFAEAGEPAVLVCAAGILHSSPIDETSVDVWEGTLGVNLTGTFLCCRAAFRSMRATGGGRIVTIGSLSGVYATEKFPGLGAYNVSKYGVVGLTEMLAVEGRDHGIAAVCVSPGAVDTQMLRDAAPHLEPGLVPDDVGRLIVSLLAEDLAPISGANIPLFSNR